MKPVEIPLSKQKLVLGTLAAFAFFALGCWFVIAPPALENSFFGPTKFLIVGYLTIVIFGFFGVLMIRKLFDSRPGLIIDDSGIIDNSSAIPAGKIAWSDVEGISSIIIQKQKMILIHLKDPETFIKSRPGKFTQKLFRMNQKMNGTPVALSANGLKLSFDELLKILTEGLNAQNVNTTI